VQYFKFLCSGPNKARYGSCLSVCPSVPRPVRDPDLKTKKQKTKNWRKRFAGVTVVLFFLVRKVAARVTVTQCSVMADGRITCRNWADTMFQFLTTHCSEEEEGGGVIAVNEDAFVAVGDWQTTALETMEECRRRWWHY